MKYIKMFDAAYMRMTLWYMAIIMAISLLFSIWVYNQAQHELQFGLNRAITIKSFVNEDFGTVVNERLDASRRRLIGNIILFNTVILVAATGASYWLARRTMRPIEEAVEAQERFTADASHQLRTPLAAMKAEIEVGLRDKKFSKDEAVELLKSNLEEVDRLGNLAEGLLALTQNDTQFDAKPVALEDVIGKVAKRLQP
jgi:signal transduction histidine kinase